ncbi:hypothetical protein ET445_04910 [Agromyces protaetiae]|uniref:Uncharacterized protein n=1 Tax=Agromyces protaetiae TaxID=2509455 RepID=A0A4P6FQG8_9MICO|nr:hypothetical protein [Agromyces protaetiae]QAY72778.1 hypothetical protein ET445_04910 [Agromyces protaetiae]
MTRLPRRIAGIGGRLALPVAALALLTLTSCASPSANADAAGGGDSAPQTPDSSSAFVSIAMPDLAPYPEGDPPLSDAESEARRLETADQRWQGVLAQYPSAVRPADPFAGYLDGEERFDPLKQCLEAAGVQVDIGYSSDPDAPPSVGWSTSTEAQAIAAFTCDLTHPVRITAAGPTKTQLGWIYDYLEAFYGPCLEANGIEVEPPPGRDVWVEVYPGYVWFPSVGNDPRILEPGGDLALRKACPDPDTYLQQLRSGS